MYAGSLNAKMSALKKGGYIEAPYSAFIAT